MKLIHKKVTQQWGWVEKSVGYQKSVYMFWPLGSFLCAEIVDCSFELDPFEKRHLISIFMERL